MTFGTRTANEAGMKKKNSRVLTSLLKMEKWAKKQAAVLPYVVQCDVAMFQIFLLHDAVYNSRKETKKKSFEMT